MPASFFAHSSSFIRYFIRALGLVMVVFASSAGHVMALTSGDVSITLISGPKLVLDSNNPCTDGPHAAYVGFEITNTSGGDLLDVEATLSGFDAFSLTGGQPATQYIGTLAAGASRTVYWYITYPCTFNVSDTLTVTVSDSNPGTVSANGTLTTTSSISANAGGLIESTTLGPGAVIGQIITYDVEYSFGNIQNGDDFLMQPSGLPGFDAGCFQLIRSEIVSSGVPGITEGSVDVLYYIATSSKGGSGNLLTVQYSFLVLCSGESTTAEPYAAQDSGAVGLKYTGNYGEVLVSLPAASNPFTVSKTASPDTLATGGTVTYTITITNTSDFDTYLSRIDDALPAGVTFSAIDAASDITAANSSVIPASGDGDGTTISFIGIPLTSYLVPANSSIDLIYTASIISTDGLYTNTAAAITGSETVGQDSAIVAVGDVQIPSADLEILKEVTASNPTPAQEGGTLDFRITVTNNGPDDATGVSVQDSLPAALTGLTVISATEGTYNGTTWGTLNIPASGTDVLEFRVTLSEPGQFSNIAEVWTADQTDPDSTPGNGDTQEDDYGSVAFAVEAAPPSADLSVSKTVVSSDPNPPVMGGTVTFQITVSNAGPDDATGVTVSDALPAGLSSPVTISATEGTYDGTTWGTLNIPAGGSDQLTFEATITAESGSITNAAEVSASDQADPDSTPGDQQGDDYAEAVVTLGSAIPPTPIPTAIPPSTRPSSSSPGNLAVQDPAFSKAGSPLAARVGEVVTWTVLISNPGTTATEAATVVDNVPDMFDITGVTITAGTTSVSGNTVTAQIPALQPGGQIVLTISTVVNERGMPGEVCNTAQRGAQTATGCMRLFPSELPSTGGQPPANNLLLLAAAAGAIIVIAALARRGLAARSK